MDCINPVNSVLYDILHFMNIVVQTYLFLNLVVMLLLLSRVTPALIFTM